MRKPARSIRQRKSGCRRGWRITLGTLTALYWQFSDQFGILFRITKPSCLTALVIMAMMAGGCVTGMTVERAEGDVGANEEPMPALYALTPFTVAADVALLPVYAVWVIGVNVGLWEEH